MTVKQLRNEIKRLKRIAGIDFERKRFEEAAKRHHARLICSIYDKILRLYKKLGRNRKLKKVETVHEKSIEGLLVFQEKNKQKNKVSREILMEDTPEKWVEDQEFMEQYEYEKCGHLEYLKRFCAYGRSSEEMLKHYLNLVNEPECCRRERYWKRTKEREELEKKRGKPIRLHPESRYNKCMGYAPEFKDGSLGWGLSRLYLHVDFSDFSGGSIVELED